MSKEKRKGRQGVGGVGGSDFVGFAVFATSSSSSSPSSSTVSSLSPVYTGSDATLQVLFSRLGPKRDVITRSKALQELVVYFRDVSRPKKEQARALSHFLHLFGSQLFHDETPTIRAGSLQVCHVAQSRLPKAHDELSSRRAELVGMWRCALADPSTEVRRMAEEREAALSPGDTGKTSFRGMWSYGRRILSYDTPMDLHRDLFPKRNADDVEQVEEQHERIVRTVLGGWRLYLQRPDVVRYWNDHRTDEELTPGSVRFLWKKMSFPGAASLRLETYALLGTVCRNLPWLVDVEKTQNLLLHALSSEREPANVPTLLHTLLAWVASLPVTDRPTAMPHFVRPLSRLFLTRCHGATPSEWTPMVLPLVALLPAPENVKVLVTVSETAHKALPIAHAVVETSALLLQQQSSTIDSEHLDRVAKCWLQALRSYLASSSSSSSSSSRNLLVGPAGQHHADLGHALGQTLIRLHQACRTKPQSGIAAISSRFWEHDLPSVMAQEGVDDRCLTTVLNHVATSLPLPLLVPALRQTFLTRLRPTLGWVPTTDVCDLWMTILRLVPSQEIFLVPATTTISLETFVMNHLLTWMVIHTSRLSERNNRERAVMDTELLLAVDGTSRHWASILREILAAMPDLDILMRCLACLSGHGGWSKGELVASCDDDDDDDAFSRFCRHVAGTAVTDLARHAPSHAHQAMTDEEEEDSTSQASEIESFDGEYVQTAEFLKACLGLGPHPFSGPLVNETVVEAWVALACPAEHNDGIMPKRMGSNPLLDALVAKVLGDEPNDDDDDDSHAVRIIVQSWRVGGVLWKDHVLPWMRQPNNRSFCAKVIQQASTESTRNILQLASESNYDSEIARHWASKGHRLLQLCADDGGDVVFPLWSLDVVGMGTMGLWERERSPYLTLCLMLLIQQLDAERRWPLFANAKTSTHELFVSILVHLSGGATTAWEADLARRRLDVCSRLLRAIWPEEADAVAVQESIDHCISRLVLLFQQSAADDSRVCRGIAVLSQLVGRRFASLCPTVQLTIGISASDVKVGDEIWYITDAEFPAQRESCAVVKVHNDLPGEVYYTIRLHQNGEYQERQTLGERLRSQQSDEPENDLVPIEKLEKNECAERERLANKIASQILDPFAETLPLFGYEIYNLLATQCGLTGGRGIGTLHYSILQKLVAIQNTLQTLLANPDAKPDQIEAPLRRLGLALGFGVNVPSSPHATHFLGLNAADSIPGLLALDDAAIDGIDSALLSFLTVCTPATEDKAVRTQAFSLLFDVVSRMLQNGHGEFNSDDYLALRGLAVGQCESQKFEQGTSVMQDNEAESISALLQSFSQRWKTTDRSLSPLLIDDCKSWESLPVFQAVMDSALKHWPQFVANSCRQYMDDVARCLYDPHKKWYAFKILNEYAIACRPLHDDGSGDDEIVNTATLQRLEKWSMNLLEEEAEELEDDVEVVAEWVCAGMMNDLETWHDDDKIDDDVACGRMLCWLSFLHISDSAGNKDRVNRSSFLAYAAKSEAANAMLDLALVYGNIGLGRKFKLDSVLSEDDILKGHVDHGEAPFALSQLASLVIFRSIEVFPTLSKSWWEMHCPTKLSSAVQEFVETEVSPRVLKSSLETIQHATAFGDMQVKGSSITREVTTTYVQDDFTLSLLIKIPPSFPFRRAEVDCSKTLGVPAAKSKRWSLIIAQMINNQGGTLNDALMLWKENVDKEFEGVEPCPVCYSVLHVKTLKLPNLECKTCHNHFHNDCLHQWFASSNKNTCVICQQPWSGTKIS